MKGTRKIKSTPRAPLEKTKPKPKAKFRRIEEKEVLRESLEINKDNLHMNAGERLYFQSKYINSKTMRKLSKGHFSIQAEIDLHGMTAIEAKSNLKDFLNEALYHQYTCVRIIHGKGLGSGNNGPVLKNKVNIWLRKWEQILAFTSALQNDGGTGAIYVLLKKSF